MWLVWDSGKWGIGRLDRVYEMAKATALGIYREIRYAGDSDAMADRAKWARSSQMEGHIKSMINLARSELGIPVVPSDLDADKWLLNTTNGVLDLRSGELLCHDPAYLMTKMVPAEYDPNAQCPHWLKFIHEVMDGNEELIGYLQRACGYSLTGDTSEHVLFVLHGNGQNGKSVLLNTLMGLMSDYGVKVSPDLLMANKRDGHPTIRATLFGRRLGVAIETDEGRRLDEALVKELTGGDVINARFLYKNEFNFFPTHKLWLATNHKPDIRGTDFAIWRRVKLIPFAVTIPDENVDLHLTDKLREEWPGILRWMLKGCTQWQQIGKLSEPQEVKIATNEYRTEQDIVGAFLEECCVLVPADSQGYETVKDLYQRFQRWASDNGEPLMDNRVFGKRLQEHGLERAKGSKGVRICKGVKLQG